jgi:hypothetical protein
VPFGHELLQAPDWDRVWRSWMLTSFCIAAFADETAKTFWRQ